GRHAAPTAPRCPVPAPNRQDPRESAPSHLLHPRQRWVVRAVPARRSRFEYDRGITVPTQLLPAESRVRMNEHTRESKPLSSSRGDACMHGMRAFHGMRAHAGGWLRPVPLTPPLANRAIGGSAPSTYLAVIENRAQI